MMWMMIMTILATYTMMVSSNMKNPVMLSMNMLILSTMLILATSKTMGLTWFTMTIYMLYLGGILMTFLILATMEPNTKMEKKSMTKKSSSILPILLMGLVLPLSPEMKSLVQQKVAETHWFLVSSWNLSTAMLIMMMYFLNTTILMTTEKLSMRTMV